MILKRGALTDHYIEDERSVVMVDESVLGLSPIATTILEAVPDGRRVSLDAVTEHVVSAFGPPDGPLSAKDLTRQQVWDLVAHKVLVLAEDESTLSDSTAHEDDDLSGQADATSQSALRSALRHLRSGAAGAWTLPGPVPSDAFVAAARQHHVVPYLAAHLDRLDLPGQARSELDAVAGRQRAGATLLAADLCVALEALHAAGVRALAFKGVALASQAFGDFAIRGAGDLDLLVPPADLAVAHEALSRSGWRPAIGYPVPGPSWGWRHFVRTGSELSLKAAHSDIDLHWHLVPTRGTFPDFDTLWSRHEVVSVAGHPVPTLALYDALTHSAGHAAKDRWRWMRSLVDVHALMANPHTWSGADRPLRHDQLLSVGLAAREFGAPFGMPPVIDLAAGEVDATLLQRVHREQERTAPDHRSYAVPGVNFLLGLRAASRTGNSAREAARLLSASVLPPWLARDEPSPHAWVAIPRVVIRRSSDAMRRAAPR